MAVNSHCRPAAENREITLRRDLLSVLSRISYSAMEILRTAHDILAHGEGEICELIDTETETRI